MVTVLLALLCAIFLLVGLLGVVLPILPGIPLSWLGLFIYAAGTGFERISLTTVVVFGVLMLLSLAIDFFAPMLGAKKYKASKMGILGAFAGITVGIFFGLWGIIFGPFVGALAGEFLAGKETKQAFGSAVGAFIGMMLGSLLKMVIILVMTGFFIASLF
ncbi:DUF456 domain-containing protein [Chloroflexota bacterium]